MAQQTTIIPANTTVKFAVKNGQEYCLMPLGSTVITEPVTPTPDYYTTTTYTVEMEIDTNDSQKLIDGHQPPREMHRYLGNRPTNR